MKMRGVEVLVTGATGGIGRSVAESFHRGGARIVVSARDTARLHQLAEDLGVEAEAADLAVPADLDRLCRVAARVDVVVSVAAATQERAFGSLDPSEVDACLDVNLRAPLRLTHAVLRACAGTPRRADVVLVGSLAAMVPHLGPVVYTATKFGLRGFALAAEEVARRADVGITIVEPGFVRDSGALAESGVTLPRLWRSVTSAQVAAEVMGSVDRSRTEVFAAPLEMRLASRLSLLAPKLMAASLRRALAGGRDG